MKGAHLGEFEEIVLLAAARSDGYGSAIHGEILETTSRDVSIPSVYVTLSRLEKKGLVRSAVGLSGDHGEGRPIKVFTLTEEGVRRLQASRRLKARLWEGLSFDPLAAEK